ncbi:MAG: histidine utilization repressor [Gammaproteobacteria bacterium]|nr:histidine utilization repressor [Gammaproteobacteria bacterium]
MKRKPARAVRQPAPKTEPRYRQVKAHVLALIANGRLQANDRVPSEHALTEALGVSRMTANRALRELAEEGYVTRLAGAGTFVAGERPASHVLRVRNIAEEIRARGHEHSSKVLALEATKADAHLAERLQLRRGARLFHSVILHFESGQPIQLEERWVCPRLAPDYLKTDFTRTTPNAYLSAVAPLHTAEHVVRASMPSARVRRLLAMRDNVPCLVIRRRTWSDGRPVSLAELTHSGNNYELVGTLGDQ